MDFQLQLTVNKKRGRLLSLTVNEMEIKRNSKLCEYMLADEKYDLFGVAMAFLFGIKALLPTLSTVQDIFYGYTD